jgi:hypothetical protein
MDEMEENPCDGSCTVSFIGERISNVLLYKLQRHNTANSKQIYLEKELRCLSPNVHMHVFVSDLYIPTIGLPILLQENMWTDPGNI